MPKLNWDGNDFRNPQDSSGTVADNISRNGSLQQGYKHGSLTEGLVAYYPMDSGSGSTLTDQALGNVGTLRPGSSGTTTTSGMWSTNSKIGYNCLDFDGQDDYVEIAHSPELADNAHLSIAVWINPQEYPKSYDTTFRPIVHKGSSSNWEYQLTRRSGSGSTGSDNQVYFGIDNDAASIYDSLPISSWSSITGEYHHLVGKFDGISGTLEVFWDGSKVLEKNISVDSTPDRNGTLKVGWDGDTSSDRYQPAELDDVRIYSRALSTPEIKALYELEKSSKVTAGDTLQ